jgi:predicted DNA-binding transcriptional regulator AlpA
MQSDASITTRPWPALLGDVLASAYCNVSPRTIRQWSACNTEGFPPPVDLPGRLTRWRRSDLDQWIETLSEKKSFATVGKPKIENPTMKIASGI